jgi:membrane-associated phospholipid phosphatase
MLKIQNNMAWWVYAIPLLPLAIYLSDITSSQNQAWFISINQETARLPDWLWANLSMLGNGWSVFALALPLLLFARKPLYAAIISGVFAGLFSNLAKGFFHTNRPAGVIDQSLIHIIEHPLLHSAMPSGHTMTAFSIATAIYFSLESRNKKLGLILFILAAGAGLSRIAVGAHWPEDVFVGCALGITSGLIGATLVQYIPKHLFAMKAWPVKIILLASLFSLYLLITDTIDFSLNEDLQIVLAGLIVITWIQAIPRIIDQEQ